MVKGRNRIDKGDATEATVQVSLFDLETGTGFEIRERIQLGGAVGPLLSGTRYSLKPHWVVVILVVVIFEVIE